MWVGNFFASEILFGQGKIWIGNNLWSKKFESEIFWGQNKFGRKFFRGKKNLG